MADTGHTRSPDQVGLRRRPILVTGSHRSGTTWVGLVLCLSGEAGYIHEPFHPTFHQSWVRQRPPTFYPYVAEGADYGYAAELDRVLRFRFPVGARLREVRRPADVAPVFAAAGKALSHRRSRRRPLVKDPMALFATPWFVSHLGATPVIVVRHPVAVVRSVSRLGWLIDPHEWAKQPALRDGLLAPWKDDITGLGPDADVLERASVAWKVMYGVVSRFRAEHPDWIIVRHEDLVAAPLVEFGKLYAQLGLTITPAVSAQIEAQALPSGGNAWTPLTPDEVDRVRTITEAVAGEFYDDTTWPAG